MNTNLKNNTENIVYNTMSELLDEINNNTNIIFNEDINTNINEVKVIDEDVDKVKNNVVNKDISHNSDSSDKTILFSNDIDRRIGKYLMDELDNKNSYINELEEIVKYQENEISELKLKLDSINKLELVAKLKSNLDTQTTNLNKIINETSNINANTNIGINIDSNINTYTNKNIEIYSECEESEKSVNILKTRRRGRRL